MRKTEFLAVTTNNNKFQSVISKQLEECNTSTNNHLKIVRFSDNTIVVSSATNPNFKEVLTEKKKEEETNLFIIKNVYENSAFILNLTPSQVRMFEWLRKRDMVDSDWDIQPLDVKEIETI